MDAVRLGLSIRALRRHRRWTQAELGRRANVSQSLIARIERGRADRVTPVVLGRICAALGARLVVCVHWQGEALDRLLDAEHAALVETVVGILQRLGWLCATETAFAVDGDRGSVDVLAFHPATGWLLVIEAKSVIPDIQATLASLDRKARLGALIARRHGWRPYAVGRILVVTEQRTNRRRVQLVSRTFDSHLPDRGWAIRRFLANPSGSMRGLWFLSSTTEAAGRHRVARRRAAR
jgi:transcriptional regulator with XRE-family HTH domain